MIFDARRDKGMSQRELAQYCDLSATSIWNIEHSNNYPNADTLKRIAAVLGLSIDKLTQNDKIMNVPGSVFTTQKDNALDIRKEIKFKQPETKFISPPSDLGEGIDLYECCMEPGQDMDEKKEQEKSSSISEDDVYYSGNYSYVVNSLQVKFIVINHDTNQISTLFLTQEEIDKGLTIASLETTEKVHKILYKRLKDEFK